MTHVRWPPALQLFRHGQPWLKSDLVFLELALGRGMSSADVAGFLGRDEDEVRDKAEELEIRRRES
jgi:hypothetical protein